VYRQVKSIHRHVTSTVLFGTVLGTTDMPSPGTDLVFQLIVHSRLAVLRDEVVLFCDGMTL
jgi:hypothetical protein